MRTKKDAGGQKSPSFIEQARRTQIITCAIETIATLGYTQASLAHIAQRAGVSKGVIGYYFKDKDELLEQVVATVYADGARFMEPQIKAKSTARAMLRVYIQTNIAFIASHRQEMVALTEIMINTRTEDGNLRYDLISRESVLADVERILRFGQHSGEFGSFHLRVMALAIRSVIDALPPLLITSADFDLASYTQEVIALFDRATRSESSRIDN